MLSPRLYVHFLIFYPQRLNNRPHVGFPIVPALVALKTLTHQGSADSLMPSLNAHALVTSPANRTLPLLWYRVRIVNELVAARATLAGLGCFWRNRLRLLGGSLVLLMLMFAHCASLR